MENIGMIRRIDNLGRLVIPKEIRNVLGIRSGDCIEIYTNNEKIILKKHNQFERIFYIINPILVSISKILNLDILITDTDKVLKSYGKNNSLFLNKKIDNFVYDNIVSRKIVIEQNKKLFIDNINYIINPLIANGDALGSIIFLKTENKITKNDEIAMKIIDNIFVNNLEL